MANLFARTRLLESKIDEYLNHTSEVGLLFREAVKNFMDGRLDEFEERRGKVCDLENHADELRREVERQLYIETLIPESRGDVLGLLEQTDDVINHVKLALMQVSVENPDHVRRPSQLERLVLQSILTLRALLVMPHLSHAGLTDVDIRRFFQVNCLNLGCHDKPP